jgi:hypothetical protein
MSADPSSRRAAVTGSTDNNSALTRAILPADLDTPTSGEDYSSHDEFIA